MSMALNKTLIMSMAINNWYLPAIKKTIYSVNGWSINFLEELRLTRLSLMAGYCTAAEAVNAVSA
ncbi:hypothetical protein MJO28_011302 [Puccinia striiformis f. sp. tritici]|uniref:Uncharacterized protein n=2 Tax=Puccinia striiformis f. sp. tritici TaxID=168172 RepID=A0ACC0DS10_9BASI|nr:hypothetical protein MJO29_017049 [Puccinia striiformis f. sp. tritici]KAI7936073.1 hypothetical protein MJO29_015376 [Puccinia striiformis f. sp. tritici]KAI7936075.1 hypothetical protein MJO29_015378 [Puccinia striiformis f. sp. tritici]KAI7938344.1 hypothetical protein MJO28_015264 [Puccinia striiformis f. sp. tritici]KAI7943774.1 hypothetical protein MJO28_011302 [Puccinia striiformis f. sp. tritici]